MDFDDEAYGLKLGNRSDIKTSTQHFEINSFSADAEFP